LAPVESRIVQRALLNVLVGIDALRPFSQTQYSFGGIRSTRRRDDQSRDDQLSAVPAAIQSVLDEISRGAHYVATADISAFFTRIPKQHVVSVMERVISDTEFLSFVQAAMKVELDNLATLKTKAGAFPTEDIGVAQGNSLSPLMGNIALCDFDRIMNEGDCRCIRYIDDFIILAPTKRAADARLRKATELLKSMSMSLAPEKSSKGAVNIREGFDFLGITICPGLIRPSEKSRKRFIDSVSATLEASKKAMLSSKTGGPLDTPNSLISCLKRLQGMIDGWGKHYWFCNDKQVLSTMDELISKSVRDLIGTYAAVREAVPPSKHM